MARIRVRAGREVRRMDLKELLKDLVGPVLFFHTLLTASDEVQWITSCGELSEIANMDSISKHGYCPPFWDRTMPGFVSLEVGDVITGLSVCWMGTVVKWGVRKHAYQNRWLCWWCVTIWRKAHVPSQVGPWQWIGSFLASVNASSIQCLVLKPVETQKPYFA